MALKIDFVVKSVNAYFRQAYAGHFLKKRQCYAAGFQAKLHKKEWKNISARDLLFFEIEKNACIISAFRPIQPQEILLTSNKVHTNVSAVSSRLLRMTLKCGAHE